MLPVDLDEHDAIQLSPCQLVTYAKDQPEYLPLPTAQGQGQQHIVYAPLPHVRPAGPQVPVVSRWQLSEEERRLLVGGADVYLTLWTFWKPLQPIQLQVGCPERCPAD